MKLRILKSLGKRHDMSAQHKISQMDVSVK
jgi:hypothetical protein